MPLLAEWLALIAPPGCLACGVAGERLCLRCTRAMPWLRGGCPRCALPAHRGARCPAARAAFSRAWSPVAYEGVARRLVAGLKFRGALPTADLMAAQIVANLPTGLRDPSAALVPVPALAAHRRARGFDPARVLTAAVARRLDRPIVDCLVRGDRGARQVGAGRRERRAPGRLLVHVRGSPPPLAILSTTSTPRARPSTCARVRWSRRACGCSRWSATPGRCERRRGACGARARAGGPLEGVAIDVGWGGGVADVRLAIPSCHTSRGAVAGAAAGGAGVRRVFDRGPVAWPGRRTPACTAWSPVQLRARGVAAGASGAAKGRRGWLRPPTPGRSGTRRRATGRCRARGGSGTRPARRPRRRRAVRPWALRGAAARPGSHR